MSAHLHLQIAGVLLLALSAAQGFFWRWRFGWSAKNWRGFYPSRVKSSACTVSLWR